MKNKQLPLPPLRYFLLLAAALLLVLAGACLPMDTQPGQTSTAKPAANTPSGLAAPAANPPVTPVSTVTAQAVNETGETVPVVSGTAAQEALWPLDDLVSLQSDRTQYHILASIDFANHLLAVEEYIVYRNRSQSELDTLVLLLEPQRLSPRFELLEIYWQDGAPVDSFSLEEGVLRIPLLDGLPPGARVGLGLVFVCDIPAQPAAFGYTARQLNLADWYAFAPVYGPDGWLAHPPARVGEHLVYDLADFRIELRISPISEDWAVAAPVPEEGEDNTRRYYVEQARNFTLSISPEYLLLQDPGSGARAYVFPEHVDAGYAALRCVSESLDLFTRLYGDPALEIMNIVEAEFPDGMEYDGLFFLNQLYFAYPGEGVVSGLCTLSVHETAHQWWYRLVGSDTAQEPWLDEALCTFSELIYFEQLYPEQVNWWWGYRINDFNPQGWVNTTIYDYDDYRAYVNAVYLRGVRFLDALRRQAGNAAMLDFLYAYAQAYRFGQADSQAFFKVWEEVTGANPVPVIEQYFR